MINKNAVPLLLSLLLSAACPTFSATASGPVVPAVSETASAPAQVADSPEFPLSLKGVEVLIGKEARRDELTATLTRILGESTAMEEKSRLQYDFQVTPESSPVALVIDWDESGKIAEIVLDGEEAPTNDLLTWLKKQAGTGKIDAEEGGYTHTVWELRGWTFTFRQGGSNEDTVYSITIAPQKAK